MADMSTWRRLGRGVKISVVLGVLMFVGALSDGQWLQSLAGLALAAAGAWVSYTRIRTMRTECEPWPWPPEFRAVVEAMARPVDPTPPARIVPPHEKASLIAKVTATREGLATLIADKPSAWPWAVFASVLVQRRNDVTDRLRMCAAGYQPRPGLPPLSGQEYAQTALAAMTAVADLTEQIDQFMLSPAFTGAFGKHNGDDTADAEAIMAVANRVMDYHEEFLAQAEACLQTPVRSEAQVFVADMGAFTLRPLAGFEEFIALMCARIGEIQDVLPYAAADATVWFEDVTLTMSLPPDLSERIGAHFRRFNQ